ncbi:MAG: alpha/beta hydrolase, partial [Candidatus Rokuibacteriota bacterium]
MTSLVAALLLGVLVLSSPGWAQTPSVLDIPTRPGVTQRVLVLGPERPRAAVLLFAGGRGGLQITPSGSLTWGEGNFLIRSRQLFASHGLRVVLVDAPSDRRQPPYLSGFRQRPEHAADVKAVIAAVRRQAGVPVWLVGTSRGTQSVGFLATQLTGADGGPDGIVLTSTILTDQPGNRPVPGMPLRNITVPTLVMHHRQDGCAHCKYADLPTLMDGLSRVPRKELLTFDGGASRGD